MLLIEKIIEVLEKEIDWHLEHPATNLSKDFQKGFGSGLSHAICKINENNGHLEGR